MKSVELNKIKEWIDKTKARIAEMPFGNEAKGFNKRLEQSGRDGYKKGLTDIERYIDLIEKGKV